MKKNFLESKLESLKAPAMDTKLDRHPAAKLVVIGLIVLAALGMLVYIVTSLISAYHASTQPGAIRNQTQSLDCRMISSDKPGGDPARCATDRPTR
ncbi:hypothetical protein [Acetobacter oeni]|uniref:Uncharacterized protein n=1 Tax=Acetobacter oeni TaxID=304077 RepID=A0A511XIV8_9PROT|nr:hypothetical protein [Acetobacter oeni]MBB3882627.1 hypothetical protein [Acetobacter oeni]NHO18731.1 hypothetical protein [Acetobacter oeni]GBR06653.1 hypothetical protein AA21952_2085 [Acetobacter oeni LMG 21952]GEN62882.1 hypothetical protein AOE01nite_11060 [Acetobacter oeni]